MQDGRPAEEPPNEKCMSTTSSCRGKLIIKRIKRIINRVKQIIKMVKQSFL